MQQTSEALRTWFSRVEPMCPELFNAAYAMCGNYELAEQTLCAAVVELWLQGVAPGMGFRERARSILRDEAFSTMTSPQARGAELTWPGLPEIRADSAVLHQARQEKVELQRLLLLRYGCGLSVRSICELVDIAPARLRTLLEHFESRCRRSLSGSDRNRVESLITQACQQLLTQGRSGVPAASRVYRAFEAEASRSEAATHRLPRILGRVLLTAMALLCAALFWLFAVLVQPEALPDPDSVSPTPTAGIEFFETEA